MVEVKSHKKRINGKDVLVKQYSRKEPLLSAKEFNEKNKLNKINYDNLKVISEKKIRYLIDENGKKLAKVTIDNETEQTINISGWKALEKGKGYGKELISKIVNDKPALYLVNTDGFTELGSKNIETALNKGVTDNKYKFVMTDWSRNGSVGVGRLWRQDVINYYITQQRKGIRSLFYFNEDLYKE